MTLETNFLPSRQLLRDLTRASRSHSVQQSRGQKGAAVIEFALVVPICLVLLMGIIEFGRAYNTLISLQGAAREGARSLALNESSASVESSVRAATITQIDVITQTPCVSAGGVATVQVAQNFDFNIPLVPLNIVTIQATASMRCGL